MQNPSDAENDLLIILVGLGAVATTLVAGTSVYRTRGAVPEGVWSFSGTVTDQDRRIPVREMLDIPPLSRIRFAAFDVGELSAFALAQKAGVLSRADLDAARADLADLKSMRGITEQTLADGNGDNRAGIEYVRSCIRGAKQAAGTERAVMLLTLSTENGEFTESRIALDTLEGLQAAIETGNPRLSASVMYTIAALLEGLPVGNLTPNSTVDLPAVQEFARNVRLPVAGNDLKTGQTFLKTVLAPALLDRGLRITGWFGTNILGNEDGRNLTNEKALAAKLRSKSDPLRNILSERDLGQVPEVVRIDYYPPRGDNKESWDCIDFSGWLDYPMSARLNVHCRDSILAAPLALDVALLLDASRRAGAAGPQDWLASFFKTPIRSAAVPYPPAGFGEQMALMRHGATRFKAPRRSLQDMTQGMTCDVTEGARRLFQEVFDEAAGEIRSRVLRTAEDDRRLESWIADRIAREMPTARILGEEHTRREPKGEAEFTVLIDPIDGSMNYYRGLPDVGMALALIRGTRLRLDAVGVALVGNLLNGWRVSAVKGAGLRMPNVRMPSSSGKFIAFDFDGNFDAQLLGRLLKAYGFVRRLGSTTLELALVASGAIDAFVDVRGTLTAENFLAPSLLVREAGGALEVHGVHGVHGVQGIGPESELNLQSGYRVLATHRAGELARLAELVTS